MSVRSDLEVCVDEAKLFLALTQHKYVKLSEHALAKTWGFCTCTPIFCTPTPDRSLSTHADRCPMPKRSFPTGQEAGDLTVAWSVVSKLGWKWPPSRY